MSSPAAPAQVFSPFLPMFEVFRAELDEHHDRRERIIKASRDITAASKKIIFALQRVRQVNRPLQPAMQKAVQPHLSAIRAAFAAVAPDLQGLNRYRYAPQISGGCQELVEALSFRHYLTNQAMISYSEAQALMTEINATPTTSRAGQDETSNVREHLTGTKTQKDLMKDVAPAENSDVANVMLTGEDYILGIFDLTGELMRFAITMTVSTSILPSSSTGGSAMDVDGQTSKPSATPSPSQALLADLRAVRNALETFEAPEGSKFAVDVEKKMGAMRESVEKVEKAAYSVAVRGQERPIGWVPDMSGGTERRDVVESF